METFATILERNASHKPDQRAVAYLGSKNDIAEEYNYSELAQKVATLAATIRERAQPGDRVILLFPPNGLDFSVSFYAAIHAGVIAVPVFPPYGRQLQEAVLRLTGICAKASPSLMLTNRDAFERGANMLTFAPGLKDIPMVVIDDLELSQSIAPTPREADDPCFLQFTSGSTGDPKGVIITHGNLEANQLVIQQALGHRDGLIGVNWLPLYHDMGLIGHLLQPMFLGGTIYIMSPLDFLKRPVRWLSAITRYGAQTSGGPNFALDLCVRRIKEREKEGLDLRTWKALVLGGEPIRRGSLERFAETFAPYGFARSSYFPCYGLAESTLFVTGFSKEPEPVTKAFSSKNLEEGVATPCAADDPDAHWLVGCGTTSPVHAVHIVQTDADQLLPDGAIGEICTRGPSASPGYWADDSASKSLYVETSEGALLRTGDLGFVWEDQLYVTGRQKDLIIVDGRNVYPQDLEATAEQASENLRPGCAAAFSVERDDREQVILIAEVERRKTPHDESPDRRSEAALVPGFEPEKPGVMSLRETKAAVQQAIAQTFSVPVEFVPIVPGSLPKTSSGKVRRARAKQMYLDGSLREFERPTLSPPSSNDA